MTLSEVSFSLASFVHELALAWQKLAIYQEGHPAREQAVGRAHAVLVGLIAPTGGLSLGVSRDALIGPEEKLTSSAAARLAQALYLREVAVLRFDEGVRPDELETLLQLLPRGRTHVEERSLSEEMSLLRVQHVVVESVDFTGLVATDSLDDTLTRQRRESLWYRILQRILNDQRLAAVGAMLQESEEGSTDEVLGVIRSLLDRYGLSDGQEGHRSVEASEVLSALSEVLGGAMSEQLETPEQSETQRGTVRHVTELLGALPNHLREGVLDAAIRELATGEASSQGLRSLSSTVSAAQMVGALRRLRTQRIGFSPRVVSLIESLVVEAAPEMSTADGARDPEQLAGELRHLFSEEDAERAGGAEVDDRLFLDLRHHVPIHARFADLDPYLATLTESRLRVDLSLTLNELLRRPLFDDEQIDQIVQRQQQTFGSIVREARFVTATRILESLQRQAADPSTTRPIRAVAERCLETLREETILASVVDRLGDLSESSLPRLHQMLEAMGPESIRGLLSMLGEENDLSRRRHIFDLLVGFGPDVVPSAVSMLDDPRWYMIRNILSLLRRVGAGIPLPVLQRGLTHADPRVRLEAVKSLPELAGGPPAELLERLIADDDARVAEAAISMFGSARLSAAIDPLVDLLNRPDPLGRQKSVRLRALGALGEIGDPTVLPRIGHLFRGWFTAVGADERRAAFESLRSYPEAERREWAKKGRRAPDAKIREICRRLEEES